MDTAEHRRLLTTFVSAAQTGDVASLEALLALDAVSLSDGDGMRGCARLPVLGRARVAQLSTYRQSWRDAEPEFVDANGCTGVLVRREGQPVAFMTIGASTEGVYKVLWMFNPSKITAFLDSRSRFATQPWAGDA